MERTQAVRGPAQSGDGAGAPLGGETRVDVVAPR